jgi:hypothetical protein
MEVAAIITCLQEPSKGKAVRLMAMLVLDQPSNRACKTIKIMKLLYIEVKSEVTWVELTSNRGLTVCVLCWGARRV